MGSSFGLIRHSITLTNSFALQNLKPKILIALAALVAVASAQYYGYNRGYNSYAYPGYSHGYGYGASHYGASYPTYGLSYGSGYGAGYGYGNK